VAERTHPDAQHSDGKRPEARSGRKTRARVAKAGRLPLSEFAFDRPGAGSPFGDDITFPLPLDRIDYEHPDR
jgi:succinate dehydrogenase / fumarate reductase iron-sulfur subunit